MPARAIALHEGEREAGVRRVPHERRIELEDRRGPLHHGAHPDHLPRVALDVERDVGAAGIDARRIDLVEPADEDREVSCGLRGVEHVRLASFLARVSGAWWRRGGTDGIAGRDDVELVRDGDADVGGRVIGDDRLRVPVAAVAVEKTPLEGRGDRLRRRLPNLDRLAVERLWRQRPSADDVDPHLGRARQPRRQVDDQAVLADHAQVKKAAEFGRVHAAHHERFGEPEGQRADAVVAHLDLQPDVAVDQSAVRRNLRVDVVRQHVVVGQVVLVVEAAALRQLRRGGVDGNVAAPPAIEHGDVFRVATRARIRQRAEPLRADLRDQVAGRRQERPAIAAEVAEIDLQRTADVVVEERRRGPCVVRIGGPCLQRGRIEA